MHAAPTLLAADRQPLIYVVQDVSLAHRNKLRYSALAASSITMTLGNPAKGVVGAVKGLFLQLPPHLPLLRDAETSRKKQI